MGRFLVAHLALLGWLGLLGQVEHPAVARSELADLVADADADRSAEASARRRDARRWPAPRRRPRPAAAAKTNRSVTSGSTKPIAGRPVARVAI